MKTNEKKGISLIVLIITIVVIVILAAAVILTISKNNPIESAKKATFLNDISSYQDELSMYVGLKYIDNLGDFDISDLDGKALEEVITINSKYNQKFAINDGKIFGTDKLTQEEEEWIESITGNIILQTSNYTDSDGRKAYIPTGFSVSAVDSEKKIDTGLVIKDNNGNEFVWVPVEYTNVKDFTTKFTRKDGYYNNVLQTKMFLSCTEPYSGAEQKDKDEYSAMVESVKKYHGYYIARYEASDDGNGNVQSKADCATWVSISWGNSLTDLSGGAVEKSRAMYPVTSATQEGRAVSTLIYGVQWDTAIDFIENYGIKNVICRKDSTGIGNYNTALRINTGSNPNYKLNNIYDMGGNAWEWTMEIYDSAVVDRGGSAYSPIEYPISCRGNVIPSEARPNIGFRVALYIK